MTEKLKIGDKVYFIHRVEDGRARVTSSVVSKVGRKYFHTSRTQFFLETLRENINYGNPSQCYRTREEAIDIFDQDRIKDKLRRCFHYFATSRGLSVSQLRRIETIVDEEKV